MGEGGPRIYLCCFGRGLAEEFDLEVAEGGMEGDRLFGSYVRELNRTEERTGRQKITMAFRVSGPDGGGVGTEGDE